MTDVSSPAWQEVHEGGSPAAEREIFLGLARDMLKIQESNRQKIGAAAAMRTLHAKIVLGVTNASLIVDRTIPPHFEVEHFRRGASLPAIVRLSNASGMPQSDVAPDMRGVALRLQTPQGTSHDLLMTNFPVSHARNARQFVEFAVIASGDRSQIAPRMLEKFGKEETERMLANIKQGLRPCASLATERYWSRGAILWGDAGPVRFNIRPTDDALPAPVVADGAPDGLRMELEERLKKSDIKFRLALQRFVDEGTTPIEDGATEWTEQAAPSVDVATLIIPQRDLSAAPVSSSDEVDRVAFNPWNAPAGFRPLGNLNRARRVVYSASAQGWLGSQRVR